MQSCHKAIGFMMASPNCLKPVKILFASVTALILLTGATASAQNQPPVLKPGVLVPELEGAVDYLNSTKPIKLADLRGKIVLIDFWTLCCINCMHIIPDLTKLEEKYKNQLVVIGVHSAKFENEKNSESIRKAMLRYEIKHPVINDAERKIWTTYGVNWWPTVILIDPEGRLVGGAASENNVKYKILEKEIDLLIAKHRANKTLDENPIRFDNAKFRDKAVSPLYFPGKIVADSVGKRLMIADSTNHRVVITDLDGKKLDVAGAGQAGNKDGSFETAMFDDPQGMAVQSDVIYVADRKNNTIRKLDLKTRTVTTIAGTGKQDTNKGGPALTKGLNSPWDLWLDGQRLFIAMAGDHQIWTLNFKTNMVTPFCGNGNEDLKDGIHSAAAFAQPSGLTSDGKNIYVADSEVSAIRRVRMDVGSVDTLVGRGLFNFGDRDGLGHVADVATRKTKEALLQHAIGVAYHEGKLYVADTYNSKIKTIDLKTNMVKTFLGESSNVGDDHLLNEPAGVSIAGDTLYIADTNAHRIRVVDLKTKEIKTLELKDVPPVERVKTERNTKETDGVK